MEKAMTENGDLIDVSMAENIKSSLDGVSVQVALSGDYIPYGLNITLTWPESLPCQEVDFAIISYNMGHSFLCLFSYGTFGLKLVYSENCHPLLAKDLAKTYRATLKEVSKDAHREYTVDLKHCE